MRSILLSIRWCIFLALVGIATIGKATGSQDGFPPPSPHIETIPAGAYVIAMDKTLQGNGTNMNLKAYGLAAKLLWNDIHIKWAIKAGKAKDGIDFTANAQKVYPTVGTAGSFNFLSAPFIIMPEDTAVAGPIIRAYNASLAVASRVNIYKLSAATNIDIRYTLEHKPLIGIYDDGGNAGIHEENLEDAGFDPSYWRVLETGIAINATSCYTFASTPHWNEKDYTDPNVILRLENLKQFLNSGGNFFAQCEGIDAIENYPNQRYQTTAGFITEGTNSTPSYANPDMPILQFDGVFLPKGGSVPAYRPVGGAANWLPTRYTNVYYLTDLDRIAPLDTIWISSSAKYTNYDSIGGTVTYLGGHNYGNSGGELNGERIYLNAIFMPAIRPIFEGIASSNSPLCEGDTLKLGLTPPISGFTFQWTGPQSFASTLQFPTRPNVVANMSGTYNGYLVDATGCKVAYPVPVVISAKPDIKAAAAPSTICQGSSSTLSYTPTAGLTVVGWFNGCTPSGANLGITSSIVVSPNSTATYSVIVTNSQGCRDTACVTVTVNQRPVLSLLSSPACDVTASSYSISLSITSGTGPFTASATAGSAIVTGNTVTISGIPSGSGTSVTVTDANGCISDPYNQAPHICCAEVTASASPSVICQGESSTLSFTGTPGVTVVGWFVVDQNCMPTGVALSTNTTLVVNPSTTTKYVVIVRNANNTCNDTSNCVTLTVNSKPDVIASLSLPSVCRTQSSVLSFTPTAGLTIVGWFVDDATPGCNPTGNSLGNTPTLTVTPTATTTYTVIVENTFGCRDTAACVTLEVRDCLPEAVADVYTIPEDAPATNLPVLINDNFGGNGPSTGTITITSPPSHGTATVNNGGTPNDPTDDQITYTPAPNYNGPDALIYQICDSDGDCDTALVTLNISPVDDLPIANANTYTIPEDAPATNLPVLINDDFGGDGPSVGTITITSPPTHGTATVNNGGTPNDPTDDQISYTPAPDYTGPDALIYQICDFDGDCDTALVTINVSPLDDQPIAIANTYTLPEDAPATNLPVLINDDFGGDGPSVGTITITSPPSHGTATVNNGGTPLDPTDDQITYTPAPNYNGPDALIYQICDFDGDCDTALVTLNISPVDDLPIANANTYIIPEDAPATNLPVLINDDFGGDGPSVGTITITSPPTHGTATVNNGGTPNDPTDDQISYTPAPDYTGPDALIYQICDFDGDCDTALVTINVSPIDDQPIAIADTYTIPEDAPATNLPVLINDDFGGDGPSVGTISITSPPSHGTATVNNGGTPLDPTDDQITYTPTGNFYGNDTLIYQICDFDNDCDTALVVITVTPSNDPPIANKDIVSVCAGSSIQINILANDSNGPDGQIVPSSVSLFLAPLHGLISIDPVTGVVTYTAFAGFSGTDVFAYNVCDNGIPMPAACDTALVVVMINPTYSNVSIDSTICEGETVTIGGNTYGLTGNYQIPFTTIFGCDSIVNLHLTVNPVKRTDVRAVICQGEQVIAGGQIFTTSVTDSIIILNTSKGCDSIITINIQVLGLDTVVTNRTICQGGSVTIGDSTYSLAGSYYVPFQNAQCIGIVKLNLTVNPNTSATLNEEICEGQIYNLAGQVFATTGSFTVTIDNAQGCDSIITLNLTVNPKVSSQVDSAICRGETVTIGTSIFNSTGNYQVVLQNSKGCDSTVNLNLIVLDNGDTTRVPQTICAGDSVVINGQVFKQAGTFYVNSPNGRCNNIIELVLTVKPTSSTTIDKAICQGEAFVVGGQTFTSTGIYTVTLQNSVGCDSVITLNLDVSQGGVSSELDTVICQGSSVTFAGQTFSTTGIYQIIYPSGVCRDTLNLHLVVNPVYTTTIDTAICEGSGISLGGNIFSLTGNYSVVLTSSAGCDSTVNLHLTVRPVKRTDIDAVICFGDQVVVGGQVFISSVTDHVITIPSSNGCDSVITLNLVVLKQDTIVTNRTVCQGQSVDIGGQFFDVAGTYYIPFQNAQCTGIAQLNLTVIQATTATISTAICEGDIYVVAGYVFSTTGTYSVTTTSAQGCDSIIKLSLTVNPNIKTRIDTTICRGQSVSVGGALYSLQGNYTIPLASASGCDSIVTLNLTVLNSGDTSHVVQSICAGGSIVVGGQTFTQAGTYYINTPNGNCSNTIHLVLTVKAASATTVNEAICQGGAIVIGNQTFTASGTYTITLQNAAGCDSIITLNLNVSQGGAKMQVDTAICEGGSVTFFGQTFTQTGRYEIVYPSGLCRDTLLLNLTVNPVYLDVRVERTICEGQTVTIGGYAFGLTGNYQIRLLTGAGCDSIINLHLIVNPVKRTNIDAVICAGDTIKVGGQSFSTSVTNVVITIPSTNGCDSVITLNLAVLAQDTIVTNRTICAGDVVNIGGNLFDQAGTYYVPFQNAQCTGIVKLNLTVNQPHTANISRTICEGQIIVIAGQVFNATGQYPILTATSQGCDSTINLNLTVTPTITKQVDTSICRGETITIGTRTFNQTGNYSVTLGSAAGCDSIVNLNLTILDAGDTSKVKQSICLGETITVGGQTFNQAGVYYIITPNGRCSNLIQLTLNVKLPTEFKTSAFICEGQAVVYGGQTFSTAGTHIITIQNAAGCDSTIILDLFVSQGGVKSQLDTSICFGSSLTFAGQTFTQTGTYQIIFPANPCRDTLLLNLTVNLIEFTEERAICTNRPDSTFWNGQFYNTPGFYSITLASASGCDSVAHLNLTPNVLCPQINIDTTILDTIPVYLIDTICVNTPGGPNVEITLCSGGNTGTGTFGTWVLDAQGCLHYTAGDTRGSNDTICVSACDTVQNTCVTTTIIITVTGLPPIAVNDSVHTSVGTPVEIPVLDNDTTLDSDPLALDPTDPIVTPPVHGTVVVNPGGTITYTPNPGHVGIDSFQYQMSDPDGADTAWVFITTENCEIPNAISPNGDGLNEAFFIPCIDINNPVFLAIYNRWGIEVYHNESYDNTWDGTYKGDPLPDGTYYYVLKYINSQGTDINQGAFVVIHR